MTDREEEALEIMLKGLDISILNKGIENYSLTRILRARGFLPIKERFFPNDDLGASVFVSKLLRHYQSEDAEHEAKLIQNKMHQLRLHIQRGKRYKRNVSYEIMCYNTFANDLNRLNEGVKPLVRLWKKLNK